MPTCDHGFEHGEPEPPVVVQEVPDPEPIADAEVEIARIEADRDKEVAKIANRAIDAETAAEIAALQARVDVLESTRIAPEPEPVVVPMPEPEAPPEPVPAPAEEAHEKHDVPKRKRGFFG